MDGALTISPWHFKPGNRIKGLLYPIIRIQEAFLFR